MFIIVIQTYAHAYDENYLYAPYTRRGAPPRLVSGATASSRVRPLFPPSPPAPPLLPPFTPAPAQLAQLR